MNVQILLNGLDITNYVVNYTTEKRICDGRGMLNFEISNNYNIASILTYDTVVLYENGNKRGTYHVATKNRVVEKYSTIIGCQDGSKKLDDYFIDNSYKLNYPTTIRYWIEKFLTDAHISYNITTTENGGILSENSSIGLDTLYSVLQGLLQQSGWYIYMDENDVAQIGTLELDSETVVDSFDESEILEYESNSNDDMLRNRVVVWGNANPTTNQQVFVDVSVNTPWDYDYQDKRTTVIANDTITESGQGYSLASKILKETTKITFIKKITVPGARNIKIGNLIYLSCRDFEGTGLVTSITTEVSKTGELTHITLDERCPKLYGFYGYTGGYVYIGTKGDGVWRKPLKFNHTWSNFSTGIIDLNIKDLSVQNGVFSCVTDNGYLYYRGLGNSSWRRFNPSNITDTTASGGPIVYTTISGRFNATTIDKITNKILAGYTQMIDTYEKSWIYEISPNGGYTVNQVYTDDGVAISGSMITDFVDGYEIVSMDNNGSTSLITVMAGDSNIKFNSYNGGINAYEPHRTVTTHNMVSALNPNANFSGSLLHTATSNTKSELHTNGYYAYIMQRRIIDSTVNTQLTFTRIDLRDNSKITRTIPISGWCSGAFITNDNKIIFTDMFSSNRTIKIHDIDLNTTSTVMTFYTTYADSDYYYNYSEEMVNFYNDTIVIMSIITAGTGSNTSLYFQGFSYNYRTKASRYSNVAGTFISHTGYYSNILMSESYVAFCRKGDRTDRVHWQDLPVPGYVPDQGQEVISWNYVSGGNIKNTDAYGYLSAEMAHIIASYDNFYSLSPAVVNGMAYVCGIYATGTAPDIVYTTYLSKISLSNGIVSGRSIGIGHTIDNFPVYNMNNAYFRLWKEETSTAAFLDVLAEQIYNSYDSINADGAVYSYGATLDSNGGAVGYNAGKLWYFNINGMIRQVGTIDSTIYAITAPYGKDFITLTSTGKLYYFKDITGGISYVKEPRMLVVDNTKTFVDVGKSILSGAVESSTGLLYMIYNGISGNPNISGVVGAGGDLNISWNGSIGSFSYFWANNPNYIPDVRDYLETTKSGFGHYLLMPLYDGNITNLIKVSTDEFPNLGSMITLVDEYTWGIHPQYSIIQTFSGIIKHMETTNYQDIPYLFISIGNTNPDFYQKDGYNIGESATNFILRNTNIPDSEITVIRTDDII